MQIDVNNDILIWAVERAGFSLEEISNKARTLQRTGKGHGLH